MKSKKEYLLLAGVIVVLVLYLVLHETDRTHYALPDLEALDPGEITAITIATPENKIDLARMEDRWVINPQGYPARGSMVDSLIDVIRDLKVTALVSDSENYRRYELGPGGRISVRAASGPTALRSFDIGKTAPSHRHTFVKLPDDPRIYHARGSFRNTFDLTVDELRDKTVLSFDPDRIEQIEIVTADAARVFSRTQEPGDGGETPSGDGPGAGAGTGDRPKAVWVDQDGGAVSGSEITEFLDTLSALECRSYIEDKTKGDFTGPAYAVRLRAGPERVFTLSIFDGPGKDGEGYPAVSSENSYPFLLAPHQAERIMKKLATEPQPEAGAGGV